VGSVSYDPTDAELWDRKTQAAIDNEPDYAAVCEWCDSLIDQIDINIDRNYRNGGMICQACDDDRAAVQS